MKLRTVSRVAGETQAKNGRPGEGRPRPSSLRLEDELSLQFNDSWGCIRAEPRTVDRRGLTNRLSDLSELIAVHVGVGEGKVRMIKEIEEPCSHRELSLLPLRHSESLLHTEVRVEVSRAAKLVSALSAEIVCWIREVRCVIAGSWLPVHQSRSRCAAVNVWRAHDVGQDRSRSSKACASEQAPL